MSCSEGDYIIKTEKTELTINTQIIEPASLAELKNELKKTKLQMELEANCKKTAT